MELTWYGTASLILKSKNTQIAVDPFLPPSYKDNQRRYEAYRQCSHVLITHGHFDHLSSVFSLYADTDTKIYVTKTPAETLINQSFPDRQVHIVQPGDIFTIDDMTIHAYQGKHVRFDIPLILKKMNLETWKNMQELLRLLRLHKAYPENDEILVYGIENQGKRVLIMGSAGIATGVQYPHNADGLVLAHQGRSDITAYNEHIIQKLQPKNIYLDHYDDAFPPLTSEADCQSFLKLIQHKYPFLKAEMLEMYKTISM